ncbi:MAG TPA: hypothetical protein VGW38_04455 [Chloroflexota bacterium]|nr:hypothetical protein [Chloroflexota bacterium]
MQSPLGYVVSCPWCWDRRAVPGEFPSLFCTVCGRSAQLAGPLWTGRLWDTVLLHQLLADNRCLATGEKARAALTGWLAESAAPPLFYDLHAAAAHCGAVAMPRLEVVKQRLTSSGYLAVRTHFSRAGIKTDAGPDHLLRVIGAPEHYAGRTAFGTRLRNVGDQERDGDPKG